MDLIQQFIDTYKMKWTFYDAAGRLAAEKLQLALQNAGIRAIVTSRAKNPARLRTKVQRRNSRREEPYQTLEEIYDDIADLSGVRVSLYFPGDRGKVDAIIVTGGIAYNKAVVDKMEERAGFIAPFTVYPGEDELLALAQGALRVLNGEEKAMEY